MDIAREPPTRAVARSDGPGSPVPLDLARNRVTAMKEPPRGEIPRGGSGPDGATELAASGQTACSGDDATTRAARVGLKLADHIIAGRSNIR